MCRHAGFQWGELAGGKAVVAQENVEHQVVRVALCISQFVLYILLISIIVVIVCFVCCSVKLPLTRPTNFAFFFRFSSPPSGGEGRQSNRVALCCGPWSNYNTIKRDF